MHQTWLFTTDTTTTTTTTTGINQRGSGSFRTTTTFLSIYFPHSVPDTLGFTSLGQSLVTGSPLPLVPGKEFASLTKSLERRVLTSSCEVKMIERWRTSTVGSIAWPCDTAWIVWDSLVLLPRSGNKSLKTSHRYSPAPCSVSRDAQCCPGLAQPSNTWKIIRNLRNYNNFRIISWTIFSLPVLYLCLYVKWPSQTVP